ncbi:hypothetical protein CEJ87_18385 [Caldifermentibacillus hisashii]|nr:hypothetical protein CEJ87_18385 [Caldifermentibacillus hisashii]
MNEPESSLLDRRIRGRTGQGGFSGLPGPVPAVCGSEKRVEKLERKRAAIGAAARFIEIPVEGNRRRPAGAGRRRSARSGKEEIHPF